MDFGIAGISSKRFNIDNVGAGSLNYLAPESFDNKAMNIT